MYPGTGVLVEEYVDSTTLSMLGPLQPRLHPVEADQLGMRPDSLRRILTKRQQQEEEEEQGPRLLYISPTGNNPTGGSMSEDITITFTEEGTYVYQCTPHLMMAMVGVIAVGDLSKNIDEISNVAAEKKSEFVMEQDRLDSYLQSLK